MAITIALRSLLFLSLLLAFSANLFAITRFDFDGDLRADLAVFRPSNGLWLILDSQSGTLRQVTFGQSGDMPLDADFDGDSKADISVWRPSDGTWWYVRSSDKTYGGAQWGQSGDTPVTGDYDGDGRTDFAVWRPSDGINYIVRSSGGFLGVKWGMAGDIPEHWDRNLDGRTDFAVYRPSNGKWYTLENGSSAAGQFEFGEASDIPIKGDFDGDQIGDFAVYRPSSGTFWYAASSQGNAHRATVWGYDTDTPVPADYDGDGRADVSVWRPANGTWYSVNSAGGYGTTELGADGDIPLPAPVMSPTTPPFVCNYYASPTGTATAPGTSASPWDLQTALNKTTLITAGKTLCLKGGTYRGKYRSTLIGATVRSAPGEWAKIDGYKTTTLTAAINATQTSFTIADASVIDLSVSKDISIDREVFEINGIDGNNITHCFRPASGTLGGVSSPHPAGATVVVGGTVFFVSGNNSVYQDFEIMSSNPGRNSGLNPGVTQGDGIKVNGNGNKFVNLVVHDTLDGITSGPASSNSEFYGCLTYNNGQTSVGQGLYLINNAGYSRVYETVALNNFGNGAQYFSQTQGYVGGDTRGLISANNGSPDGNNFRQRNLLVGTASVPIQNFRIESSHFFHPHSVNGDLLNVGWGAGVGGGDILNNYFVGGNRQLEVSMASGTVTGNKFYSMYSGTYYGLIPPGAQYTWNNNTYYAGVGRWVYAVQGVGVNLFPAWRTVTGFDANSTETSAAMPDTVVVRPNSYQAGRANIVIYVPSGATSINVNLSATGLANGQAYSIKNAFNYFGPNVVSGTYNSSSPTISLPLTGAARSVATPIGHGFTPATTLPDFGVFIVVPSSS